MQPQAARVWAFTLGRWSPEGFSAGRENIGAGDSLVTGENGEGRKTNEEDVTDFHLPELRRVPWRYSRRYEVSLEPGALVLNHKYK